MVMVMAVATMMKKVKAKMNFEDGDARQQLMRQGGSSLTAAMIEAGIDIDDDYEAVRMRCSS